MARMIVFEPNLPPRVVDVDGFKGIQHAVGGYIERVTVDRTGDTREINAWCDEEGLLKRLPPNVLAAGTPLFGIVVLAAAERLPDGDQREVDLTEAEIRKWSRIPRAVTGGAYDHR